MNLLLKTTFVFLLFSPSLLLPSPLKVSSISLPQNYMRIIYPKESFSGYLQNLQIKNEMRVSSYRKEDLTERYPVLAVIDKPLLFKEDLEQCADYTMRLWADYHRDNQKLNSLYLYNYNGSKIFFRESKLTYEKFLRKSFASSNSYSIKKGGVKVAATDLKPGDMFVQNETGGIGHVSIILDHARSEGKEDLFLIGFSFMPAQDMHIEKAPDNRGKAGWFSYQGFLQHLEKNYPYGMPVLRRY